MPTILVRPDDTDDDVPGQQQHQEEQGEHKELSISVFFSGLRVDASTAVTVTVVKPELSTVGNLNKSVQKFCEENTGATGASVTNLKLNFGGVTLTDPRETIAHLVARVAKGKSMPKLFVSGVLGVQAEASAAAAAAARRSRSDAHGGGGGGLMPEMSEEQAENMAETFATMIMQNPSMLGPEANNPEFRELLRDRDALKSVLRAQFGGRYSRAADQLGMAGAMGQLLAHPDGAGALENALGRAGFTDNQQREPSGPSVAEVEEQARQQQQQQQQQQRQAGALLPGGFVSPVAPAPPPQPTFGGTPATQQPATQKKTTADLLAELIGMGFDNEIAQLAAEQADGELEKALALLEEWQE